MKDFQGFRIVSVMLAAILVLLPAAACQGTPPTATPAPTLAQPTPHASTTAAPPRPTLVPTITPYPAPPRVVRTTPEPGQEQHVTSPVVLVFDRAMDRDSLDRAFRIEPQIPGTLRWRDDATVQFVPEAGFRRDTRYRVVVDESARAADGTAPVEPFAFEFATVGYLEVTDVHPRDGTIDVATDTAIRVAFNRPVVPLVSVGEQEGLPEPLLIEPPVAGEGRWVNTSVYLFQPTEPLEPGREYTVAVEEGLQDTTGGVLEEPFRWSFTTQLPRIASVEPQSGAVHVAPTTAITVTFSQPMAPQSVEERFSLLGPGDAPAPGTYEWDDLDRELTFHPAEPLLRGATYTIRLRPGALAAAGEVAMDEGVTSTFGVAAVPRVVEFRPQGTAKGVGGLPQIVFSSPIDVETFLEGVVIEPDVELFAYWEFDDTVANLVGPFEPSTQYTVTLTTDIRGRYGEPLAEAATHSFRTEPLPPSLWLDVRERAGSYSAHGVPTVPLRATNIDAFEVRLFTLSPDAFMRLLGPNGWQAWDNYRGGGEDLLSEWTVQPEAELNEQVTIHHPLADGAGALSPGLYYLEVTSQQVPYVQRHVMVVTGVNALLKTTADEALVWLTDLASGEPLAERALELRGPQGDPLAATTTDADGVATLGFAEQEPWASLFLLVEEAGATTIHLREWSRGVEPWEFELPYNPYRDRYRTLFYTDRAIYRPGQTVHFKGVVREDHDARYTLPAGQQVSLSVWDPEGREIWAQDLRLGDVGTLHGEVPLEETAPLGYYRLEAVIDEAHYGTSFNVAEYRTPEFEVTVTADRAEALGGESVDVEAVAGYYFGGPVADAQVRWSVRSTPFFFDRWGGPERYSFSSYPEDVDLRGLEAPGMVAQGRGMTDGEGRFRFTVEADIAERIQSQVFTIEAAVTDVNNQEVSATTSVIVHKGAFYIGLVPERYVGTAGAPQRIHVLTVDPQGEPSPGVEVDLTLYRREWYSVREQADDGRFYWTTRVRQTEVATRTVTADAEGRADASFTPEQAGNYKVTGRGVDEFGNVVTSEAFLWISGREYVNWGREDDDSIELVADKDRYRPGETAQVLVPSPFEGPVTALLTIERGRVLEHRLLTLETNSDLLEIPIVPDYAPNVYVSIAIVRGTGEGQPLPDIAIGYVNLPVSTEQQELTVTITPDREGPYQPRDRVTLEVLALDHEGEGVEAEFSLKVVDRAVEALTGGDATNIVEAFYGSRALGVGTASTISALVDRLVLAAQGDGKGGGGGEGPGALVRQDFPETALWEPAVRTGPDGRATVSFTLPDNLTTWRAAAQAVTADTLVGMGDRHVLSTLDLLVRPVLPRFLVVGDEPVLGAVVHNNTDADLEVAVTLDVEGIRAEDLERRVDVAAHGRATLEWPALVEGVPEARVRMAASGGGLADAVEIRLPVYRATSPETVATAGLVTDQIVELVRLPEGAVEGQGELRLRLEPSLAAGLGEALDYVETYPYECVEQTISRFLPNVVTLQALDSLGIDRPDLAERLPRLAATSLQRLYAAQNLDGGWGWWAGQRSSPFITAYAVLGLAQARRADLAVDADVLARATRYLRDWLNTTSRTPSPEERAFVLYALAEAGDGDLGRTVALYDERHDLALYARSLLASTLYILQPEETDRLETLANELSDAAILSATGVHWEEDTLHSRWMNTNVRTTAMVLRALLQVAPDSGLLPGAVRWLMAVRENARWSTTQENVWSILALTGYMVNTGELQAEYDYDLWINGVLEASEGVTAATVDVATELEVPTSALHAEADNQVVIQRGAGPGRLYYSAFLEYWQLAEDMEALDRGIIVQREYRPAEAPEASVDGAAVTETVLVHLTLIAPHDLYYLVLEDPLPAGGEALDVGLATTSQTFEPPTLRRQDDDVSPWWWPEAWNWADRVELRDEKAVLFAEYLPRGTYEYVYAVRLTTPGRYQVLPATAYEMYFPDTFGRSAGTTFTVEP